MSAAKLVSGRYQHYKGAYYDVLGLARHSETEEWLVVYKQGYGDEALWVRPYAMFTEEVTLSDGQTVARFALVTPSEKSFVKD